MGLKNNLRTFVEELTEIIPEVRLEISESEQIPLLSLYIWGDSADILIEQLLGPTNAIFVPDKGFGVIVYRPDDDPAKSFFNHGGYDAKFDNYEAMKQYVVAVLKEDTDSHTT